MINRTGFDSDPEREFAIALEDDVLVLRWIRPPQGQLPIHCRGEVYNVDFVAETESDRYLIEVKPRDELNSPEVAEKARAAIQWCKLANEKQLGKPWSYKLLADDTTQTSSTLAFMLGMAVKDLSS